MTETARRLGRLGRPHARARTLAVALAGAGLALAAAAGGLRLAPHLAGVLGGWAAIFAVVGLAVWVVRRARRAATPRVLAALVERAAGSRAGSVVTLLAPPAGGERASAALLAAADARAVAAVARAAADVERGLSRGTRRRLWTRALVAAAGAGRAPGLPRRARRYRALSCLPRPA